MAQKIHTFYNRNYSNISRTANTGIDLKRNLQLKVYLKSLINVFSTIASKADLKSHFLQKELLFYVMNDWIFRLTIVKKCG